MLGGATKDAVCLLEFDDRPMLPTQMVRLKQLFGREVKPGSNPVLERLKEGLDAYFAGRLRAFSLPLDQRGTPFQESVWTALHDIPYGQTWSYARLAERLGNPDAVRAVARANGDNRMAVLIPCHRVIGADGSLTGYGGGLRRKKFLLELEQGIRSPDLFDFPAT